MIELEFIERLIRILDESGLDHVEIEKDDARVRISRSPPAVWSTGAAGPPDASPPPLPADPEAGAVAAAEDEPGPDAGWAEIASPMVGTFYIAPSPEAAPFVEVGSEIGAGDVLCIIEAMKLMNELEAETAGRIVEVCVRNGEPVEFGQVLFRLEPR